MNIVEIAEHCGVPPDKIKQYLSWGMLNAKLMEDNSLHYGPKELWRISAIHTLMEAGFSRDELRYFPEENEPETELILALKKYRCRLLCDIHTKQQLLDCLDYIILKLKNSRE